MLARFPEYLQTWANILGIACALLTSIQYLPQIYTTLKLRHVGSLSIVTMMIQVPGSYIMATSLAVRLGRSGWSTWVVYVVAGSLQGCLLAEALWFQSHHQGEEPARKISSAEIDGLVGSGNQVEDTVSGHAEIGPDEETPLLREGQRPADSPAGQNSQ